MLSPNINERGYGGYSIVPTYGIYGGSMEAVLTQHPSHERKHDLVGKPPKSDDLPLECFGNRLKLKIIVDMSLYINITKYTCIRVSYIIYKYSIRSHSWDQFYACG